MSWALFACGGDGSAGRGAPGELDEIPSEDYDKLVEVGDIPPAEPDAFEGIFAGEETGEGEAALTGYAEGGYLEGPGDAGSFDIYAKRDEVDVTFEWPRGEVDFWVKVYGEEGDELGDFDLDDGEIIQLLNGGKFSLEIYSKEGGGAWEASYRN